MVLLSSTKNTSTPLNPIIIVATVDNMMISGYGSDFNITMRNRKFRMYTPLDKQFILNARAKNIIKAHRECLDVNKLKSMRFSLMILQK